MQVEGGGVRYTAQRYERGELCDGKINRVSTVFFHCNASALQPRVYSAEEVSMCNYELHMELQEWCVLQERGIAALDGAGGEEVGGEEEGEEEGEREGEGEEEGGGEEGPAASG